MKAMRWLVVLGLVSVSPAVLAASFDCAKAATPAEKTICKSAALSELDSHLQSTYQAALEAAAPASKPALVKEQRNWIRYVRNICEDETCLGAAYQARTDLLKRNEKYLVNKVSCDMPPDGKSCRSVVTYRDPGARVESFNKSLTERGQNGRIIGCSRLIDLPVGTANGNHSFGGLCTLQSGSTRSAVEICNDDMVGHFSMKNIEPQDTPGKDLVDFTHAECFGG
ncbi:lysozyme inhibitor LprI family protein [Frateuria defendens]|uniref:lysozyme inhibitor LprI family protein n=1 Tax=Frateuria defendens TaxID=2219559 RepID=UPI001929E328|nr:lysozyme inhibitor LprI family protein [Frateuria defendens]